MYLLYRDGMLCDIVLGSIPHSDEAISRSCLDNHPSLLHTVEFCITSQALTIQRNENRTDAAPVV